MDVLVRNLLIPIMAMNDIPLETSKYTFKLVFFQSLKIIMAIIIKATHSPCLFT